MDLSRFLYGRLVDTSTATNYAAGTWGRSPRALFMREKLRLEVTALREAADYIEKTLIEAEAHDAKLADGTD
jgi:hypothetical protein